ncbi:MAG TPA: peptidylprolyl isomerase, partial [Acidimicrobiia bacterium]|nr:peptidylprolyl isomerase [Acidimicrobiia bacterium]
MRRFFACFVAAGVIATIGSGCSSTLSDAATITFTAKGTKQDAHVTRDDLLSEVSKIVANQPFATWLTQNKFTVKSDVSADTSVSAIWLSQLIHQQAIDALFASRHLTVTSAVAASAAKDVVNIFPLPTIFAAFDATFRRTLTDRQARTEALLASYTDTSDAAGQAFYNTHKSQFACASGKNVAHILVATQAKAQLILTQLKAGANFATLAQQDSTDAQSGAQGGLLGCLTANEFVPQFQSAAQTAPIGTPIGPVHSQFGYHVILVTAATTGYAAYRSQVRAALTTQGQSAAQAAIDALLKGF